MGWPKFVHNMWMATADGGLAVAAYGPNEVTTQIDGKKVKIIQETDYPFKEEILLRIEAERSEKFPIELRIPAWCKNPSISVGWSKMKDIRPGSFYRIERKWKTGDKIKITFPMDPRSSYWINESVAVERGPLVYSLLIKEGEWKSTQSYLDGKFHTYEITPAEAWNYALVKQGDKPEIATEVSEKMPKQPFKAADAPVKLKLKGFKTDVDGWGTFRKDFPARAKEPPQSPLKEKGELEDITLIPYGSTEIRITQFPWAD